MCPPALARRLTIPHAHRATRASMAVTHPRLTPWRPSRRSKQQKPSFAQHSSFRLVPAARRVSSPGAPATEAIAGIERCIAEARTCVKCGSDRRKAAELEAGAGACWAATKASQTDGGRAGREGEVAWKGCKLTPGRHAAMREAPRQILVDKPLPVFADLFGGPRHWISCGAVQPF